MNDSTIFNSIAVQCAAVPRFFCSQVIFGSPRKNCLGSGICRLYTLHGEQNEQLSCESIAAYVLLFKNQLRLVVPIRHLSAGCIKQHFGNTHFVLDEDFCLPPWLSKHLAAEAGTIPAGTYPLHRKNSFFWIDFPIVELLHH